MSALRRLAGAVGILPGYVDMRGKRQVTADATRVALLAAMGIDAASESRAKDALAALRAAARDVMIEPVRVVSQTDDTRQVVRVRWPRTRSAGLAWRLDVALENGEQHAATGRAAESGAAEITIPLDAPLGYHDMQLTVTAGRRELTAHQRLIVVPARCVTPGDLLGEGARIFGVIANLYTLRSRRDWGVGDFEDLGTLAEWAGACGADFVGLNPLHALRNRGADVSPYNPVTRLFKNPIYIDVCAVPELADAPELRDRIAAVEMQARLAELREASHVRYAQVMAVKGLALDALYHVFLAQSAANPANDRVCAYERFVHDHEPALSRYAAWMVAAERAGDARRADFHRWVQFELDRQLGVAAQRAADAGMRVGLYQDLAIGSAPNGADVEAYPELFVRGVSVGAPPDPYSDEGQNWGFPPLDPRAMRRDGYRYVVQLLRSGFRHAGALRIDHVMGLFRLFWIPSGLTGRDGAYVRYPAEDLLGVLALESVRHNALVVGEDLGTVPRDVPPALAKWGVLSSRVLYFQRRRSAFMPAAAYPTLALATANTHDTPTLAGYWRGRDVDLRSETGLLAADGAPAAREERARDRAALIRLLERHGVLPRDREPITDAELVNAVHAFLCRTPSALVGLSLDDVAGELDPVNVPGVGPDQYPSWTRKMHRTLEEIASTAGLSCARGR